MVLPERYGYGMKLAPIVKPSARKPAPEPAKVDLRRVFMTGTILWVLALVVSTILVYWAGVLNEHAIVVCLFGLGIGVALLIWEHFHRQNVNE